MMKRTPFAALCALLLLAACSKEESAPTAHADDPEEESSMPASPPEPKPEPSKDYNRIATGMVSLLADKPECQRFVDELRTIAQTPMGSKPARDPAMVVAEAHQQGCSKKSQGQ